ncbi:DUF4168 domain-containing protein [Oscillatoria sp. FACHB-1406]|uniref:DUF4168 domain-containing protein n=1 Tax=Oscillatoria sp. FACHB-1406 TaxID=2692846 RepID=UPI0016828FC4|nr:DUF4168 domain-containing protein [Oscillatoria sp. FACHB-1406]MBD2580392.1 DUF4168 domain-containing protein [Oscillatoria sp. FACHB-1406]
MLATLLLPSRTRQAINRAVLVGAMTAGSLFLNLIPAISGSSHRLSFQTSAYAQSINQAEITNYARAVLAMEPLRQATYDDIKRIVGSGDVPNIVCSQPSSFSSLPGNARQIAVNYCNKSREFVRSSNLTVERFNEITDSLGSNADLKRRIQNAMIELLR